MAIKNNDNLSEQTTSGFTSTIYCIGDIHISIFVECNEILLLPSHSGKWENFEAVNVGQFLARNLLDKNNIFDLLKNIGTRDLLFCFGEIDCRAQVKRYCVDNVEPNEVVSDIIDRYFKFINEVKKKIPDKCKVYVLSITPEIKEEPNGVFFKKNSNGFEATYGTLEERRKYKELFNNLLKNKSKENECIYIPLNKYIYKKDGTIDGSLYFDDIHLHPAKVKELIREVFKKTENNILHPYQDYVIKDGKFIGKFDEMYNEHSDPWHQSEQPNQYSRSAGIIHINNFEMKSVLECGCGLGYYSDRIKKQTSVNLKSIDISKTAIEKAKINYPNIDFEIADISTDLLKYKDFDCVLLAEIVWYILPNFTSILQTLANNFQGKYLIINQVFYEKGIQKYGTEYFTTPQEFISFIVNKSHFELMCHTEAHMIRDKSIETSLVFKIK